MENPIKQTTRLTAQQLNLAVLKAGRGKRKSRIAKEMGVDLDALKAAMKRPAWAKRLKRERKTFALEKSIMEAMELRSKIVQPERR